MRLNLHHREAVAAQLHDLRAPRRLKVRERRVEHFRLMRECGQPLELGAVLHKVGDFELEEQRAPSLSAAMDFPSIIASAPRAR